jgi:hypothetical protein
MRTDTELVALLRSTLTSRAEDVQDAPSWVAPATAAAARRPWLPVLAAAAAVAAAIAAVAVGVHASRPPSPAHPKPNPKPNGVPLVCATQLPASWRDALSHSGAGLEGQNDLPLSMTSDGTVVAYHDTGVLPGDPREVVVIRPDGSKQVVYQVQQPDQFNVQSAYLDGTSLVVAIGVRARPPKHTVPGSTPGPNVRRLLVVDLQTGNQHTIASTTAADEAAGARTIQAAVLLNHTVYWDVRERYTATTGAIKAYSLRTGQTRTVYRGGVGWLIWSAGGVGWYGVSDYRIRAGVPLPKPVTAATDARSRVTLSTDGTHWAWAVSRTVIGYWQSGASSPTYLRLRTPLDTDDSAGTLVVSGRFVFTVGAVPQVIDARNRAAASINGKHPYAGQTRGQAAMFSGGSVVAGYAISDRSGQWVDGYWSDSPSELLRINTSSLPALKC